MFEYLPFREHVHCTTVQGTRAINMHAKHLKHVLVYETRKLFGDDDDDDLILYKIYNTLYKYFTSNRDMAVIICFFNKSTHRNVICKVLTSAQI